MLCTILLVFALVLAAVAIWPAPTRWNPLAAAVAFYLAYVLFCLQLHQVH